METLTITLETVTPFWTGGVKKESERVHATGILGSLRWWYEVLVRGLEGNACDPSNHTCGYDPDKPNKGLCDVCRIFGATGWKRRFRLMIRDRTEGNGKLNRVQATGGRLRKNGKEPPAWYVGGRTGQFTLSVIPLTSDPKEFDPQLILGLLKLIEKWGALGAKPQLGSGVIRIVSAPQFVPSEFVNWVKGYLKGPPSSKRDAPSLQNMFFTEIEPKPDNRGSSAEQTICNLKYDLRQTFRSTPSGLGASDLTELRHWVCGKEKPDDKRKASKIAVAQAGSGKLRVWGWIPKPAISGVTRGQVMDIIVSTLKTFYTTHPSLWREFSSARDTIKPSCSDPAAFLESLLTP